MEKSNDIQTKRINTLFEADLLYKEKLEDITDDKGKVGKYIGSGDGTVNGSKIQGSVRWDLFEKQANPVCDANFTGTITTNDNAVIHFHTLGFFRNDQSNPNKWRMFSGVQFDTDDERYEWLNSLIATWEGEFDMETYRHHYHVYFPVDK